MEGEEYENNDLNCRADNARSYQDAILIIKECETIIQGQKKDHISTVYRQGCIFNRFKDSNKFLKIMKKIRNQHLDHSLQNELDENITQVSKIEKIASITTLFKRLC